jgi:stress responsive alpha/beta barrel protein
MLLHLVCFKYKSATDDSARADHRKRLAALRTLDGVVDLQVGADIVQSPRSYDTGLMITFPDRAALDAYQKDPRHVPVAQLGVSLSEHIVAVDFQI